MKELIEALKNNEKPFGLLSKPEQECLRKINELCSIECYQDSGGWSIGNGEGFVQIDNAYCRHCVYRIKADYNPEPEIVECKVRIICAVRELSFDYKEDSFGLEECVKIKDWYGLKWSDGQQTGADDNTFRRWLNGKYEAPEFVLMREVK